MTTSLSQQLKKLATPASKLLVQKNKKASLLFDPSEAAAIDRSTFYDIGISGLTELIEISDVFEYFSTSLFDESSKNFERSVETAEVNKRLNNLIKQFLCFLSPYFLLKPSQKVLEWLIVRYHVQDYNTDELVCMALPYHGTRLFARLLQVIDLESNNKWDWLLSLQKKGVPLSKTALFNRCASDVAFLKMICDFVVDTVEVYGTNASKLSTLYAFYSTTIVGGLQHCREISELHITYLLPSILKGISFESVDYTSSAFLIIAALLAKFSFSPRLHKRLVEKITKVGHITLRKSVIFLLNIIYQSHKLDSVTVSEKAINHLISQAEWFIPTLSDFLSSAALPNIFFLTFTRDCLRLAKLKEEDDVNHVAIFIKNLLNQCIVDSRSAHQLIRIVIEECSDINAKWCQQLVKKLENQYPIVWDDVISTFLREKNGGFVSHLLGLTSITNQVELFARLNHVSPEIRKEAIKSVAENAADIKSKYVASGLIARWNDNDPSVIQAMFLLPKHLQYYSNSVRQQLLMRGWSETSDEWNSLLHTVIGSLNDDDDMKNNPVMYTLLLIPLVVGSTENIRNKILQLDLPFMEHVKSFFDDKDIISAILRALDEPRESPSTQHLIDLYDSMRENNILSFLLLLFLSSSYKQSITNGESNWKREADLLTCVFGKIIPDHFHKVQFKPEMSVFDSNLLAQCFKKCKEQERIPLEALHYFFMCVLHTPIPNTLIMDGWCDFAKEDRNLIPLLFQYMTLNMRLRKDNDDDYDNLISLLMGQCDTFRKKIMFLFNMSLFNMDEKIVQLHALKMVNRLLKSTTECYSWMLSMDHENIFVPTLLIHLFSTDQRIRESAMDTADLISSSFGSAISQKVTYLELLKKILEHKEEIMFDRDQLPSVIFGFLCQDKDVQDILPVTIRFITRRIFDALFDIIIQESTPIPVSAAILPVFDYLQDSVVIVKLMPLAKRLLFPKKLLDADSTAVFINIIDKFNVNSMSLFENAHADELVDFCLKNCADVALTTDAGQTCLGSVFFRKMADIYDAADVKFQKRLLAVVLNSSAGLKGDRADLIASALSFTKRVNLNCELVVEYLNVMRHVDWKRYNYERPAEWSTGIAVLETIQNKKKLTNCELILPLLFEVLTKCCEVDDKMPMEYEKQVCLSSALNCSEKLAAIRKSGGADLRTNHEKLFNVELIVNCLRTSTNPQTHHHALFLLGHCVSFAPDQVLNNVMAIFTFMGSSVLRQDDAFSFQIISNILDTIVPLIVNVHGQQKRFTSACNVLKTFAQSIADIPDHRRRPLLAKLMKILNEGEYMHVLFVYAFEFAVKKEDKSVEVKYVDCLAELVLDTPVEQTLKCFEELLKFANSLPHNVEKNDWRKSKKKPELLGAESFEKNKHLHHLKYIILNFVASILSKTEFIYRVSKSEQTEMKIHENHFKGMIEQVILYLKTISEFANDKGNGSVKFWKIMNAQSLDILNKTNALLTCETFLTVIEELIRHECLTVQRKSLELLNWRLQHAKEDVLKDEFNSEKLLSLVPSLIRIVGTVSKPADGNEIKLNQQTAAISLKMMVKYHYSFSSTAVFKKVLMKLSSLIRETRISIDDNVLASLVLTIAELTSSLKVHAIESLPKFVPEYLRIFRAYQKNVVNRNDILLLSIIIAIQKLVETLPNFLSPYLEDILYELVVTCARFKRNIDDAKPSMAAADEKSSNIVLKLEIIRQKLSEIPYRILLPSISKCFSRLCKKKHFVAVKFLMQVLSDSFPLKGNFSPELTSLYLDLLDFRCISTDASCEEIFMLEGFVITSLSGIILKCSESNFRPFYHKLYDWGVIASKEQKKKKRVITYYRVLSVISEKLRSIFVLFASNFIRNAAELLEKFNNSNDGFVENTKEMTDFDVVLTVDSILKTFLNVFKYDTVKFMNQERFDLLNDPLVNQIENTIGNYEQRSQDIIIPCLARFASAASDDSLWKQFNYTVLLKTRHSFPNVRMAALDTVCLFATLLGDNFLTFLPETVPFIAELLEDETEMVEKRTQEVVHNLEQVLGEPIHKYF